MSSPLPPDPYNALGVAKDATPAQIKQVYRKLVLKCHPDKIQDPEKKQAAADEFHKIHTAYEIISDEDRRARYDAQVRLAELKRTMMEERAGVSRYDSRRPAPQRAYTYTSNTYSPREQDRSGRIYEERRPSDAYGYTSDHGYDAPPRATSRKDDHYERPTAKRSPPRDDRERAKATARSAKEADRARGKEKSTKREKEIKRERETKYAPSARIVSDSDSDTPFERESRRRREEDEEEQRAREAYFEQVRRQKETTPRRDYFYDDPAARAAKTMHQEYDAREYIGQTRSRQVPEERTPSPVRASRESREKTEYVRDKKGRPTAVKRGSARTRAATESPRREKDPRTKAFDTIDEDAPRRPPTLSQSYSSPDTIRVPNVSSEKVRAATTDPRREQEGKAPPQMRRAETMPNPLRKSNTAPLKSSNLRKTAINHGHPTPEPTPETEAQASKVQYGKQYADDYEFPTPNGYKTEVREPASSGTKARNGRTYTRSPSPVELPLPRERERERERPRQTSARYPTTERVRPTLSTQRATSSTSYMYTPQGVERLSPDEMDVPSPRQYESSSARPAVSRENSDRLFGEIPRRNSPTASKGAKYSPPPEDVRYRRDYRPEDVNQATGYATSTRRPSMQGHASYSRSGSYDRRTPVY